MVVAIATIASSKFLIVLQCSVGRERTSPGRMSCRDAAVTRLGPMYILHCLTCSLRLADKQDLDRRKALEPEFKFRPVWPGRLGPWFRSPQLLPPVEDRDRE